MAKSFILMSFVGFYSRSNNSQANIHTTLRRRYENMETKMSEQHTHTHTSAQFQAIAARERNVVGKQEHACMHIYRSREKGYSEK